MSVLLAIETSGESGFVALRGENLSLERVSPAGTPHSAWLLPAVESVLADAGLTLRQLDAIAFGAGPGSFTGLRLACGVAQGLALGADLPLLGVCSLEAVALAAEAPRVWVGADARMSEIYYASYAVDGDAVQVLAEPACAPPELVPPPAGDGWLAAGTALRAHGEVLRPRLAAHCTGFRPEIIATAAMIARLALPRVARGEAGDPALAAPLYVRDKVALTTAERLARGGRA